MEDKIGSPELGWWLGRQDEDSCTERGARGVGGVLPAVEAHRCPAVVGQAPAVLQTTGGYSAEVPGYNHRLWIEFHLYSVKKKPTK